MKTRICVLIVLCISMLYSACVPETFSGFYETRDLKKEPRIVVDLMDGEEEMGLETYIAGVVAGEMKPEWHPNAYGAQAIIARTFALSHIEETDDNRISVDFREAQAYKPEQITPVIQRAVEETRGQVALYDGDYIWGWFHSSAGGRTTFAQVGLNWDDEEPPYVHSVQSPDDLASEEVLFWEMFFSRDELLQAVEEVGGKDVGMITHIEPVDVAICGRPRELRILGPDTETQIPANDFRNALGSEDLKSTLFETIEPQEDGVTFTGRGFGHGVGMSQWGALAMARRGNSPQDIVRYYFQDIHIHQAYE